MEYRKPRRGFYRLSDGLDRLFSPLERNFFIAKIETRTKISRVLPVCCIVSCLGLEGRDGGKLSLCCHKMAHEPGGRVSFTNFSFPHALIFFTVCSVSLHHVF